MITYFISGRELLFAMAYSGIVRSKIVVPRNRSIFLARDRLLAQIETLIDQKLITLVAPPGYGKTTFLITAAYNLDFPVCWYALESHDNSFHWFVYHLITAISQRIPQFKDVSDNFSPDTPPEKVAVLLAETLNSCNRNRLLLLMDDFQCISNPQVHTFLGNFLEHLDYNCCLLIASELAIQLPGCFPAATLESETLAFQPDEIQALIHLHYQEAITPDVAANLARLTNGSITALFRLKQGFWEHRVNQLQFSWSNPAELEAHLNRQFLELPPAVQHFLLRTSLLEEFDAQLCEVVFGPANYPEGQTWYSLTQFVRHHNLVTISDQTNLPKLRYQPQFQQFLWHKMHQTHPTESVGFLHRLAEIHAAGHAWEQAYTIYQNLGTPADTLRFVEQHGPQLVLQGQCKLLNHWLEAVPSSYWDNDHPWLLALGGITAAILGETKRGHHLLAQAVAAFQQIDDHRGEAYAVVWQAEITHILGDYPASLAHVHRAETLITTESGDFLLKVMVLCAKGQSLLAVRQTEPALVYLRQALELSQLRGDRSQTARANLKLGIAYKAIGQYQLALHHFELAHVYYKNGPNCTELAKLYYHQGQLHHFSGQYLQAFTTLRQALTCAEQCGCIRRQAYILAATGNLYVDLNGLDSAARAFQLAQKLAMQINDQALLWSLELAQASVARLQTNLSRADIFHKQACHMASLRQIPAELGACAAEAGRLALARKLSNEARGHFEQALLYFTDAGQNVDQARTYLSLAQLHYSARNTAMAATCLSRTFELTASQESMHPLVMTALTALRVLNWARKKYHSAPSVANLLAAVEEFADNQGAFRRSIRSRPLVVPFAPPQLIIQTLGSPIVLLNGHPITRPEWQNQKKVREIFFYLLSHLNWKSRDSLGHEFWPNSSLEKLSRSLTTTKCRLNTVLGKNVILHDSWLDSYRFNDVLDYHYDVHQFEQLLHSANAAKHESEQKSCLNAALELYQGSYLPDVEGCWVLLERHRLSQLYLQASLKLAGLHFSAADYEAALAICRNSLKEDPAFEPAHCLIMTCYAKLGNRPAIVRQYKQYRTILLDQVGIPVSAQTNQLYQSLLA